MQILINLQMRFGVVADAVLEHPKLSFTARVILAWALGRSNGFKFGIGYMQEVLGLSDAQWATAKKQLAAIGFYRQYKHRQPDGTFLWINEFTDAPLHPSPQNPGMDKNEETIPPKPRHGKQGDNQYLSQTPPRESTRARRARTGGSLSGAVEVTKEGISHHANPRDLATLEAIGKHSTCAIQAAVAAAKTAAGIAWPSAVLKLLSGRTGGGAPPAPAWATAGMDELEAVAAASGSGHIEGEFEEVADEKVI